MSTPNDPPASNYDPSATTLGCDTYGLTRAEIRELKQLTKNQNLRWQALAARPAIARKILANLRAQP